MAGSVASLVMVAQHAGSKKSPDDQMAFDLTRAWAKQVHGCVAATCYAQYTSYQEFLTKLRSYTHIGTLAILAHSGGDTLTFYDPTDRRIQEYKTLATIVGDLGATVPQVDKVEFLGCQVGRDPEAMWNFATALGSHSVIGHTFFHAYQAYNATVVAGTTAAEIEDQIPFQDQYLIPNTDLATIASHPGKAQIFAEWFTPELRSKPLDQAGRLELRRSYKRRDEAVPITVDSLAKAQTVKQAIEADLAPVDVQEIRVVQ